MRIFGVALVAGVVGMTACAAEQDDMAGSMDGPQEMTLGPADGHDLPGVDLERVQVGAMAPDFTLSHP